MNPALLAALINQIALPELTAWLRSLHTSGAVVDDATIIAKLASDTNLGEQIGTSYLASHPAT